MKSFKDIANASKTITLAKLEESKHIFTLEQIKAFRKVNPEGCLNVSCGDGITTVAVFIDGNLIGSANVKGIGLSPELDAISNALLYAGYGINTRIRALEKENAEKQS